MSGTLLLKRRHEIVKSTDSRDLHFSFTSALTRSHVTCVLSCTSNMCTDNSDIFIYMYVHIHAYIYVIHNVYEIYKLPVFIIHYYSVVWRIYSRATSMVESSVVATSNGHVTQSPCFVRCFASVADDLPSADDVLVLCQSV